MYVLTKNSYIQNHSDFEHQWCSQPQSDAQAQTFSEQLVIQVIASITPVYIAIFIGFICAFINLLF